MKNIFKLMGLALMAGALMTFASCGEDDPITPGTGSGVVAKYTITATANDANFGTVTGSGEYEENTNCTLTAIANPGYKFVNWNDGNANNPRIITVKENANFVANFEKESGVSVSFGTANWSAGYVNAQMAANGIMVAAAQTNATSMPQLRIFYTVEDNNIATGTYTDGLTLDYDEATGMVSFHFGNPYIWYYESTHIAFSSGTEAGDWMSKSATLQINAIDLDAMTATIVANATMAHMTDIMTDEGMTSIDVNDCETRDLTITLNDQTFSAATKRF